MCINYLSQVSTCSDEPGSPLQGIWHCYLSSSVSYPFYADAHEEYDESEADEEVAAPSVNGKHHWFFSLHYDSLLFIACAVLEKSSSEKKVKKKGKQVKEHTLNYAQLIANHNAKLNQQYRSHSI